MNDRWIPIVAVALGGVLGFADEVKPFEGSYEQALKKASSEKKPLMVDFYADW